MYPKIPIGLTVTKHDGLLSLPGTNNLRALPLVKYLALFFQGWVNLVICSLSSLRQQWKRDSPSGSSPKSLSLWVPCYPMQPQAESQDQPTFLFGVFQMCVLLAKLDGPRWLGTPWAVAGSPLVLMSYCSPAFYWEVLPIPASSPGCRALSHCCQSVAYEWVEFAERESNSTGSGPLTFPALDTAAPQEQGKQWQVAI